VCDLAGTEPAGDIVCALYEKKSFEDGTFEYVFKGPHPDMSKTKELQEQGKKINLSLSEMAQFFMKMAEAVKKKQLKPGIVSPLLLLLVIINTAITIATFATIIMSSLLVLRQLTSVCCICRYGYSRM
jgi:hypothetical protein